MNEYKCKLTTHGKYQLEWDVHYPLSGSKKSVLYNLDCFMFVPSRLGLNRTKYGVKRFFDDMQSRTRHTPALIPLARLVDENCSISPLARINRILESVTLQRDINEHALLYELRTLVNVFNAEIKSIRQILVKQIKENVQPEELKIRIENFLTNIAAVRFEVIELHSKFVDSRISDLLRRALKRADEAMSLAIEKELFRIYTQLEKREDTKVLLDVLTPQLSNESRYRQSNGYKTIVSTVDTIQNEGFLYRESMLKRWAQAAMYMDVAPSRVASRVGQIVAGFAAALAMLVAVVGTLWATQKFPQNSVPWAILIVVIYIIKDRLKEIVRNILISKIPNVVSDKTSRLIDPAAQCAVGSSRSRVRFTNANSKDIPAEVIRLRHPEADQFRNLLPPEDVIHFHKSIKLDCEKLFKVHQRLDSITEIMRLKLDRWLSEMDDPTEPLVCMRDGKMVTVTSNRVYHINLVLRFSPADDSTPPLYMKHRLVINRDGIIRIDREERLTAL